jgi:hypothetical protein
LRSIKIMYCGAKWKEHGHKQNKKDPKTMRRKETELASVAFQNPKTHFL